MKPRRCAQRSLFRIGMLQPRKLGNHLLLARKKVLQKRLGDERRISQLPRRQKCGRLPLPDHP
jgi:hypothetical protein